MKRNNKILLIVLLTLILIAVAVTSFSIYIIPKLRYTSNGAVVVTPGETNLEELPENTRMVLAVPSPDNPPSNISSSAETIQNNKDIIEKTPNTDFELTEEEINDTPYLKVLIKYYNKEEVINLIKTLMVEDYGIHLPNEPEKPVTDAQIELYKMFVDILQREDVAEDDKKCIQETLDYSNTDNVEKAYNEKYK